MLHIIQVYRKPHLPQSILSYIICKQTAAHTQPDHRYKGTQDMEYGTENVHTENNIMSVLYTHNTKCTKDLDVHCNTGR